jgi:hypothetical protein
MALVLAVIVAILLAVAPTGHSESVSSRPGGSVVTETSNPSLLDSEGPSVLIPLAVPALLAGLALACRRRAISLTTGGLCLAGCLLGAASIGLFFLPVAVLLLLAARWEREELRTGTVRIGS